MRGRVLALDLASKFGWAAYGPGRGLASAVVQLPKTGDDLGRYIVTYENWLTQAIEHIEPQFVVFERPILPSKTMLITARKLYGLANSTEVICYRREIRYLEVHAAQWRKHFMGKGTGKSAEMKRMAKEACSARGWDPLDDNEADALGLLDYAMACLELPGLPEGPLFRDKGRAA